MNNIPEEHKISEKGHLAQLKMVRERIRRRQQKVEETKESKKEVKRVIDEKDIQEEDGAKLTYDRRRNPYKETILNHLGRQCWICGSIMDLEIHHVVPLSEGGKNELQNLIVLCHGCHRDAHYELRRRNGNPIEY